MRTLVMRVFLVLERSAPAVHHQSDPLGWRQTRSASAQGLITTQVGEGRYSNVWMITADGLEQMEALDGYLNQYTDLTCSGPPAQQRLVEGDLMCGRCLIEGRQTGVQDQMASITKKLGVDKIVCALSDSKANFRKDIDPPTSRTAGRPASRWATQP